MTDRGHTDLLSVQPFGIHGPGGGARILRALFSARPGRVLSVCTAPAGPSSGDEFREIHLPSRPGLGRVESTRLNRTLGIIEVARRRRFERALTNLVLEERPAAIHAVAHSLDFIAAHSVAKRLGIPFMLSVHDDLGYALRRQWSRRYALAALAGIWRDADARFVISEPLGDEYAERYGRRPYRVVTDGVPALRPPARAGGEGVRVYFAGLVHLSYHDNFAGLMDACELLQRQAANVSLHLRCGGLPDELKRPTLPTLVLPFASEAAVAADLAKASVLYLPLPFDRRHSDFVRFSLSTKVVTYLGSGVPIVYHGPAESALSDLLGRYGAAVRVHSLEPAALAEGIKSAVAQRELLAGRARRLVAERFILSDQQRAFWEPLENRVVAA